MTKGRARASILALLLGIAGGASAEDAILVLDASGSMWGKVEGKTKVEIARSVIGGILDELPPDRALGLVAYGHRREGDCADIEQIVPVGTDRAAVRTAVGKLNFKGKTPLSAAVRFAAEKLRYEEKKATVILVSDGAETCGVDPCALGRDLEATGVHFTAHIIGFGLASDTEAAGLRCLAQATGGRYFGAKNARELTAALAETVAAPAEAPKKPALAHVTLRATELDGGPEVTSGLTWEVKPASGAAVFAKSDGGVEQVDVPPGSYDVRVSRASDGLEGAAKLDARAGGDRTVTVPLELDLKAELTLTPANAAPAGSKVSVAWTGPNRKGDYVTVVKAGAETTAYLAYRNTDDGNPLEIALPAEPGPYEMRYVLGAPQRVLASVPIAATVVSASLDAPAEAVVGGDVDVSWTGPDGAGDWITVVKPDAATSTYNDYFEPTGSKRSLEMPVEPGAYELRYVQGGQKIIARKPITLKPATAEVTAPATAKIDEPFEISWSGPNNRGDWLTIVPPTEGAAAYRSYVDADGGSPAKLTAPSAPGTYEVRYVLKGKSVLARKTIEVR